MSVDLSSRSASDPITAINVTPLVDVCLVLVIIFMVTAPLIAQNGILVNSVKKEVGPTQASQAAPEAQSIYVKLTADGGLSVNGEIVAADSLQPRVKALLEPNPDSVVYINAENQVAYGRVVEVLDAVRQGGAKKLAVLNDQEGLLERTLIFQKP